MDMDPLAVEMLPSVLCGDSTNIDPVIEWSLNPLIEWSLDPVIKWCFYVRGGCLPPSLVAQAGRIAVVALQN